MFQEDDFSNDQWVRSLENLGSLGIENIVFQAYEVSDSLFCGFWLLDDVGLSDHEICISKGHLPDHVDLSPFCHRVIGSGAPLLIQAAPNNTPPLSHSYYGHPVSVPHRMAVGVLCAIMSPPKALSAHQIACLESYAQQISLLLQLNYLSKEMDRRSEVINEMNRLSNLGKFSMFVAHEINNGLALIKGCASSALQECEQNDNSSWILLKHLELIQKGQLRIQKIVDGIKFYSRRSELDPFEILSVREIFSMTSDMLVDKCRLEDIDLTFQIPEQEILITCCPTEISQILMNLIHNSMDAICCQKNKWIKVEIKSVNEAVEFSVTDCGPRISDELCSKIMTPFFTTKERGKGTGLGLSICKSIVDNHRGKIFIDRDSINTRFVFVIPLNR